LDVAPKICQQRVRVGETIRLLVIPHVSVIALAGLVVVSQYASPIDDKRQTILESVTRPSQRVRDTPNHDLDKRTST